jgi:chromosome segregation and condensation protein ScpB
MELSEASLEAALIEIRKHCDEHGIKLTIQPTHWRISIPKRYFHFHGYSRSHSRKLLRERAPMNR